MILFTQFIPLLVNFSKAVFVFVSGYIFIDYFTDAVKNFFDRKQQNPPNPTPNPPPQNNPTPAPTSTPTPTQKPDPTNDDAPKTTFKRIIPPNPDPDPTPPKAPIQTPPSYPISVKNPPYFKQAGKFIYQPLEHYAVNFYTMPMAGNNEDWSEVNNMTATVNKGETYIDYLTDNWTNKTGKYKISDIIPFIFPPSGIPDGNPVLMVGTEVIGKLIDAYENYSDGYLSNPIWFVPEKINIHNIKGDTSRKRRLSPEFDDNFKPVNRALPEIIFDQNIFKVPKEVTMEQILQFAGYCATFEGGAEKWEEYKKDPTQLTDLLNNWDVPTSDDILNETVTNSTAKFQKQKLKIDSFNEQLLVMAGTLYVKAGLHEFPTLDLPGIKDPKPMPDPNDPNSPQDPTQLDKSNVSVKVGSLAAAMSYFANWFNFKIGDFPAEVEVPDPKDPDKTTKQTMDISTALQSLVAGTGIGLVIANFNKDTNLRNAGEIEAAKNAAQKSAECSCVALDGLGNRTQAKARCKPGAFNFINANGLGNMLSETKRCYTGVENDDPATIKEMLQNILFGVNVVKGAFFKNQKEIENQEQVLKDLLEGRIDDDQLKDFINKFNDQKTPITKDYPVKAKITKKDTTGGTP